MEIYGRCGTSSWLVGPFWILFEAQKLIERQTLHPWRGKPKRGLHMSRSQQYWSTGLVWVWAASKCKPQASFHQELRQPVSKTGATPTNATLLEVLPADFPEMGEDYEAFRAIGVAPRVSGEFCLGLVPKGCLTQHQKEHDQGLPTDRLGSTGDGPGARGQMIAHVLVL